MIRVLKLSFNLNTILEQPSVLRFSRLSFILTINNNYERDENEK